MPRAPFTLVAVHAHPDDEVLLTGGTLAKACAEGHRVIVVTATDGGQGLAAQRYGLGEHLAGARMAELHAAARALGVSEVRWLGYADSGLDGTASGPTLLRAGIDQAAQQVAEILTAEGAHVVSGYDPRGGYGHPDHVRVHEITRRAAALAATPVLLEATVDRTRIAQVARIAGRLRLMPGEASQNLSTSYTARSELTHAIDVRAQASAKRAAMRAHASQATGGGGVRTLRVLGALPLPVFRWALGTEWFVQVTPTRSVDLTRAGTDIFDAVS